MKIFDSEFCVDGWSSVRLTGIFAFMFIFNCILWLIDGVFHLIKLFL